MHVSLAFAFSLLPFANIQMYHQGVKLTGPIVKSEIQWTSFFFF